MAERPAGSGEMLPAPRERVVPKGDLPVPAAQELAGHPHGAPARVCRAVVGCCP